MFNQRLEIEFSIIVIYVNNLNLVEIFEEFIRTITYLKRKFEIKDFWKDKILFRPVT